jgi:hydrogenase 3 maturation protease
VVDCGIVPENYTSIIRKHHPDRVILVDAADMQLVPGSYRIIPPEKVSVMNFSTHSIPLSVFISFIRQSTDEVILIGIQPRIMEPGTPISARVIEAGERVTRFIINDNLDKIKPLEEERPVG